jgi:acetone carboxylase alpha subunit
MGILKERLLEREHQVKEERFPELELQRESPVEWEILYTRLSGLVQNAREAGKQISASPVIREMGEYILALLTPEGDSVCFSSGLLIHIASMGYTVKWMLKNDYEEEVGINEGDYFFNNDPFIGGSHSPDQTTVTPIFYQGELVAWAGALSHCLETGAVEPGGMPPSAQSRFEEGIFWPCIKIGENDKLRRDLERIIERGTRMSTWWILDQRARVAAIRLLRDGVRELAQGYGIDFFRKALHEYVENTRRVCKERIRNYLFPGRYRSATFHDVSLKGQQVRMPVDYENAFPLEINVFPDGRTDMDYEGTSPAGLHPNNTSRCATEGMLCSVLIQRLFYDIKPNHGIFQAMLNENVLHIPDSCIAPSDITTACSIFNTVYVAVAACALALGRALYAMGLREEVSGANNSPTTMFLGGTDQYGRPFAGVQFEGASGGLDSSAVMDGTNCCYATFNPEGDMSDAEVWERVYPVIFLGRRTTPDGGGMGRYRGGNGITTLYFVENTNNVALGGLGFGDKCFVSPGLMGAYPAASAYNYMVKNTNLQEVIKRQMPIPQSEGDDAANPVWKDLLKGETVRELCQHPAVAFKKYELYQQIAASGGGLGDPIDRAPALVKRDLENGDTTIWAAQNVYGVAVDSETFAIDYEETKKLREEMREARAKRGIPTSEYVKRVKEQILTGDLPEMPKTCINQILQRSPRFLKEFKECWGLPEDFKQIP